MSRPLRFTCLVGVLLAAILVLAVSAAPAPRPAPLSRGELRWLSRVTFGIDGATIAHYQQLGREKFLDEQLHPAADPPPLAAAVAALPVSQQSAEARLKAFRTEQQRINTLAMETDKQQARTALNQSGNEATYETAKRHLLRALASPAQLREQMTWFWMNHFSVFSGKANIKWTLAEYEEQVVRPRALGSFRDLVLATVTAPAMLEYLDNAQSAASRINENYARELMELHTLGVSGGPSGSSYTQKDVQELARILTGAGVNLTDNTPKLPAAQQALYVRRGLFEFNPARHDAGTKTFLGETIAGSGFAEIEQAVAILCRQPAAARFITAKIARYFVADDPSPALVERLSRTFQRTDGSIDAVLRDLFLDREVLAALGVDLPPARGPAVPRSSPAPAPRRSAPAPAAPAAAVDKLSVDKLKDPMQFVVSSLRLAYEGKTITNYHPIVNWLSQLGEPLYGRVTPDGYALTEAAWTSSGQMVRRFEIARAIGSGNAGLFNTDDNQPGPATGFPMIASRLFYDVIEPALAPRTRTALASAASQQEWNTLLLSSPDWMQR